MKEGKYGILRVSALTAALVTIGSQAALAQGTPLAWDAVGYFKYNIEQTRFDPATRKVKVVFSVSDPTRTQGTVAVDGARFWDIKNDSYFKSPATLRADIGWNTSEVVNTGSNGTGVLERTWLDPLKPPTAFAPAAPIQVNLLSSAVLQCTGNGPGSNCEGVTDARQRYYAFSGPLPAQAAGTIIVGIEGHPSNWPITVNGAPVLTNIPVKSEFTILSVGGVAVARRQIVDINKCKVCHDNGTHGDSFVPRLSLHGANRNEEPGVCVICHNPNQTDIPWRLTGAEESIDFKRMVHGIHAGEKRNSPLAIIGRGSTVVDFSHVKFPADLKNCMNCHIEVGGKGTYELPLLSSVLGSTIVTQSKLASEVPPYGYVDFNPFNDLKITPTAATCTGCHGKGEDRQHMIEKGGASFSSTYNASTGKWSGRERCASCHGPGREKDVRKVHGLGGS